LTLIIHDLCNFLQLAGINNFPPFFDFPNLKMEVNVDNNIFLIGRVCAWMGEVFLEAGKCFALDCQMDR
jgi:hypothetical protein